MQQKKCRRVALALGACIAVAASGVACRHALATDDKAPPAVAPSQAGQGTEVQLASAPRVSTDVVVSGDGSVAAQRAADAATWPFDPPSVEALRQSPRKIFAHWHIFPISVDNQPPDSDYWSRNFMHPDGEKGKYKAAGGMARQRPLPRPTIEADDWRVRDMQTEVRRAVSIGLDGFIFNIVNPHAKLQMDKLVHMLEAAQAVDPGFKVQLMIDAVTNRDRSVEEVAGGILQVASHPSVLRASDGRLVLSVFAADRKPADWWKQLMATLGDAGVKVYFVPVFLGGKSDTANFTPISDGLSVWGPRTPSDANAMVGAAAEAHGQGKIWMQPVAPQDFRPNKLRFWEAVGSELYRTTWRIAIEDSADWVQLITWNDYSEGTEIAPSTGTQYAFYDLAAYYGTWFKTGIQPPITRDVLYYFHRIMPVAAQRKQEQGYEAMGREPPQDIIELLAFLTEPGTLQIQIGDNTYVQDAKAGITSFKVPLAPGRPRFKLIRNDTAVIDLESAFEIRTKTDFLDFLYRAGSSSRPPVEMIANPPS